MEIEEIAEHLPVVESTPYSSLQLHGSHIRLVDLHPSESATTVIECSLRLINLEEKPRYVALSYVWGSSQEKETILVNGTDMQVTSNLGAALHNLRHSRQHRTLWIDAICINQTDKGEKTDQLRRVGDIFRNASSTIAWLGIGPDTNCENIVHLIKRIAAGEKVLDRCLRNKTFDMQDLEALQTLFASNWWSRMWTLQEVILPQDAFLLCGTKFVRLSSLFKCYRTFAFIRMNATADIRRVNASIFSAMASTFDSGLSLLRVIDAFYRQNDGEMTQPLRQVLLYDSSTFFSKEMFKDFFFMLGLCRGKATTDPRDKIFGLLGMAPKSVTDQLRPSYYTSVQDVYTFCAYQLVRELGLLVLNQASHVRQLPEEPRLPSWVPDWRVPSSNGVPLNLRSCCDHLFNAHGKLNFTCPQYSEKMRLRVEGLWAGTVTATLAVMPLKPSEKELDDCLTRWESALGFNVLDYHSLSTADQGKTMFEKYWKTITGDLKPKKKFRVVEYVRCDGSDIDHFLLWRLSLRQDNDPVWEDINPEDCIVPYNAWHGQFKELISGRRLFVYDDKSLGLGPPEVSVGDRVCILAGGPIPFILRPTKKTDGYHLIGECLSDGIVDGELEQELGDSKWEELFLD